MTFYRLMVIPALMLMVSLAQAEYYKYTDTHGVVHYTDNILEVPKAQREALEEYQGIESTGRQDVAVKSENATIGVKEREQALKSEKAALDKAYATLAAEKKVLEEEARKQHTAAESEAFTARVEAYNSKTADYEQKRMVFKEKVDAFNAEVKAQ